MATKIQIAPLDASEWQVAHLQRSAQPYVSRRWNYEDGLRLVLASGERTLEASIFRHYLDDQHVKTVVELPTSYGCSIGCNHCASGMISIRRLLTKNDLANVYAATQKHLSLTDRVDVVSFAGIGECSLNVPSIFAFARNAETPAQGFSFTTVGIRPHFVTHVSELAREVNIKLLQVSLLHHSPLMLSRYINRSFSRYDLNALVERGLEAGNLHIRFNFVLMAGFNDGEDCINQIDARISPLRERCSVRISRLNETPVSRDNRLLPTTPERVHEVAALFQGRGYDAYAFMSESNDDMNCGQLVWRQYS